MHPLSSNHVVSELSYAYLHAVAAHAEMRCKVSTRLEDNNGIDAQITAWGPFPGDGYLEKVDVKIQLKATTQVPPEDEQCSSCIMPGTDRRGSSRLQPNAASFLAREVCRARRRATPRLAQ
jgi:hypothetical protein